METTVFSIEVIYAPSGSPRARSYLWYQLKDDLLNGQWILLGYFNMTEHLIDASRSSPLLSGRQSEA